MLSETIYKRMLLDREFNSSLGKVNTICAECTGPKMGSVPLPAGELNRAYHSLHKAAFDVSILFSPRASKEPSRAGDFLVTLVSISKIGRAFMGNVRTSIEKAGMSAHRVKRTDKLLLNLSNLESMLLGLEEEAQSSLSKYLSSSSKPQPAEISRYSKTLLKVRRSYFRMRHKLDALEKTMDFSSGEYEPAEPIVSLMSLKRQSPGKRTSRRASSQLQIIEGDILMAQHAAPVGVEGNSSAKLRKTDTVDLEKTAFIASYKLPKEALTSGI